MQRLTLTFLLLLLSVSAPAAVTGTVVGDDGAPVAGARVRAFAREPFAAIAARLLSATPEGTPLAMAETAANGTFSVDAKQSPTIDVVIDAPGRDPAAFTAADGDDAGAILLRASASQRQRAMAGGKPLPNAVVWLGRSLVVRTDAQGTFPAVVTGEQGYVVHPDFAVAGVPARARDVELARGTSLQGRVVGRDGTTPVAGATVTAGGWPLARSGADGAFTIAHAPARLRAVVALTATDAGAATIDPSKPLVIRLGTAATLTGSVTSSKGDAAIAGARVTLTGNEAELSAVTDARGRFSVPGLLPGTYAATVHHPLYAVAFVRDVHAAAPSSARAFVVAPRSRVRGTVVGEDRKPVPSALVSIAGGFIGAGGGAVVTTGAAGEFTLTIPGSAARVWIVAAKSGYATAIVGPVALEPGETKTGVALTLAHGFPMRFQVVDGARQAVAGATIDLAPAGADVMLQRTFIPCSLSDRERCRTTGADGSYEIRLAEGRYDIAVNGDLIPLTVKGQLLNARSSPLTLTVDRGVDVSGRVTFHDGTPAAGAHVGVRGSGNSVTTDANGAFTLHRLPRAAVALVVMTADEPPLESAPVDVTPPARDVAITLPTPASIEGRVVDRATGQPVTQFSVAPMRKDGFGLPGGGVSFNSADGAFVLKRVLPGSLELRVMAGGYVPGRVTDLTLEEGRPLTGVEVKLDRGARVTGRVTSAGRPVTGVNVRTASYGDRMGPQPAMTDADGNYTLDGVAAGEQTLDFMKQGYVSKRKSVDVAAAKEVRLDVDLDRGRELRGRVIERGGQPVAGARVVAGGPATQFAAGATSDANGEFTIAGIEDGRYRLTAQKSGYVTGTVESVEVPATQPLTVTLDRGATITGRVTGIPDAELGQVRVSAMGQGSSANETVDASGRFTMTGIPDGRVTVTAYKLGARTRQSAPKVIEVVNGSAPPVDIDFSAGLSVHGRITRNGVPVPSGNIYFAPRTPGALPGANGVIGLDGTYEVNGLEPGDHDVRINSTSGNDSVRYTVTGSATFDIDLHGGTVRGVVLDAATGAPIADARVSTVVHGVNTYRYTATDSNGRFALDALPDGTVDVHAEREHYAPAAQSVTISGGNAAPVELRLTPGQEAVIRIVDGETGTSLQGMVVLFDAQRKMAGNGSGRGEDGATHVWVPPGSYSAQVSVTGYVTQTADVVVPGRETRVALLRAAKLVITSRVGGRFRITSLQQAPPPPKGVGGIVGGAMVVTVPPGVRLPVDNLRAGPYQVDQLGADLKSVLRSYTVMLTAGQTTALDAD